MPHPVARECRSQTAIKRVHARRRGIAKQCRLRELASLSRTAKWEGALLPGSYRPHNGRNDAVSVSPKADIGLIKKN